MAKIRLILRADDAGSCDTANDAVIETWERGVITCMSVMAPGPAFAGLAAKLRDRSGYCLGLHVTLNAEWMERKWGPVLPVEKVPTLVDENGFFFSATEDLHRTNASVDEMCAEMEAQLALGRSLGLRFDYIDEHMGVGWVGGLGDRIAEIASKEGLKLASKVRGLPMASTRTGDIVDDLIARIDLAPEGTYVYVVHPGMDTDDMRAFYAEGGTPGVVARDRDRERRAMTCKKLKSLLSDRDVDMVTYTDVL